MLGWCFAALSTLQATFGLSFDVPEVSTKNILIGLGIISLKTTVDCWLELKENRQLSKDIHECNSFNEIFYKISYIIFNIFITREGSNLFPLSFIRDPFRFQGKLLNCSSNILLKYRQSIFDLGNTRTRNNSSTINKIAENKIMHNFTIHFMMSWKLLTKRRINHVLPQLILICSRL